MTTSTPSLAEVLGARVETWRAKQYSAEYAMTMNYVV
jgi:hypothetical protein